MIKRNEFEIATADQNDSKLWQALGAGSIVIGVGVAASDSAAGTVTSAGLVIPFVFYLLLVASALLGLWPRTFSGLPQLSGVWESKSGEGSELKLEHDFVS